MPKQRGFVHFLLFFIVLIIIVLIGIFLFRGKKNSFQTPGTSPPNVSFESYEKKFPSLPTVPAKVNGYTVKINYTVEEAKELGKKLGLTEVKVPDDRFVILSNMTDINSRGILTFDKVTGGISFQSYGVIKTESLNPEGVQDTTRRFLTSLNLLDPTISCPITYERKGLTGVYPEGTRGVTFVECHRDWSLVGLPILNTIGILNVPESTSLSSLSLGQTTKDAPDDPSIFHVAPSYPPSPSSPSSEGKARPNDFNTITVGIASDGRILSLESTMRKITDTKQYSSTDILSPEDALQQFINHKSSFSLTIPAGSGSIDWNKVYPDNKANGKKAIITDYLLTYLENPGQAPQERLVPMYIIRGTAELSSGYTVRFMETVPALKSGISFLPKQGDVAGVASDATGVQENALVQNSSLKLGTFQPDESTPQLQPSLPQQVNPNPSIVQATPPPGTSTYTLPCQTPDFYGAHKELVLDIPGLGQITTIGNGFHQFFFKSATFPVASMAEVRDLFFGRDGPVVKQYTINVSRWIGQNSVNSTAQPATVSDMVQLFMQINDTTEHGQLSWGRAKIAPPVITDEDFKEVQRPGDALDMKRTRQLGEYVAQNVLEALNNNQISTLSTQPDIFPAETLVVFSQVLLKGVGPLSGTNTQGDLVCFISGSSPSLYLYPEKETQVTVSVGGPVSYSYPSFPSPLPREALAKWGWSVVAKPGGTLTTYNVQRTMYNRLYYEYDKSKVSFTEPKEGFIVERNNWEAFIRDTLAPGLGLTAKETEDLVVDITNALSSPSYPYLKISLVDRKELDEQLPITIYPYPADFHRIHLLLTPILREEVNKPVIQKLPRNGFTAIELGVSAQ